MGNSQRRCQISAPVMAHVEGFVCVLTWLEGSYVAVVLMALVLLPWLNSVRAKQPKVCKHTEEAGGVLRS